ALQVEPGDIFLLATDGAYEFVDHRFVTGALETYADDLDAAARAIVEEAYRRGSDDNITVQILRIDEVPQTG
ncbi:SpoIIE family protein phosphatase, partial [Klebsiella pneumoniae]|uniref:SpoIIE family protein phosphatase n=3 Tax=Pseudomonadota TaxID=1224 RepID=UPI0013D7A6E3